MSVKVHVTLRDVARETGVSHVAVSMALRNSPEISEATRNRIKKAAARMGYSPDPILSALSSYRNRRRPVAHQANIGWLYTDVSLTMKGWGEFGVYVASAAERARQLGYILDEINIADEFADPKRLGRLLNARNITGIVLPPCPQNPGVSREFKLDVSRFSVVQIGYSYGWPKINIVANSLFRTTLTAVEKAIALGYERIGLVLTKEVNEITSWQFVGGYLAGVRHLPKQNWIEPLYVNEPVFVPVQHKTWMPEFFQWLEKQKIDCVIGPGYGYLCKMMAQRGISVPDMVGYIDIHRPHDETYLTGIDQNSRQIGSGAVDLLVSMMHRHEIGIPPIVSNTLIEGSWVEGKTATKRPHLA
jgi:DNA-binding LacI/PurR family transcriptional regulator